MMLMNSQDDDEAMRHFELMKPMLGPCAELEGETPTSEITFLKDPASPEDECKKSDTDDVIDPRCSKYTFFDEARNWTDFPVDENNNPIYNYFPTFNWGQNDIQFLGLLEAAQKWKDCCRHGNTTRQQVFILMTNMDSNVAVDKFDDLLIRWTEADMGQYAVLGVILKIIWTYNHTLNANVKAFLDHAYNISGGYIQYVVDPLDDPEQTAKKYGMCAPVPPVVPEPSPGPGPLIPVLAGFGGFLLLILVILIVIAIIFTQTSWLNRPAYLFFRFLENRLKLKFAFLVKIHQDLADAGFDRYVQEYKRGEDEWEVDPQNLHISTEKLGSGSAATVYMGILSGVPPIVKLFPRAQLLGNYARDENHVAIKQPHDNAGAEERIEFLQEIRFMKTLNFHPHVLTMLGCYIYPLHPLIITELCELGDLLSLVRLLGDQKTRPTAPLEEEVLPVICWQICDALGFLASIGIIHRDVAARNVLVNKAKVAKLSDFGLCRKSDNLMYSGKKVTKLPLKWMAPEAIEKAEYSHKSDIWSYGVVLYEIFSFGTVPYPTIVNEAVLEYLKKGDRLEIPPATPDWMEPLMESCWETKPELRPAASDLKASLYAQIETTANSYGYLQMNQDDYDEEDAYDDPFEVEMIREEEPLKFTKL